MIPWTAACQASLYRYLIVILIMFFIIFLHNVLKFELPESRDFLLIMFVFPVPSHMSCIVSKAWVLMWLDWREIIDRGAWTLNGWFFFYSVLDDESRLGHLTQIPHLPTSTLFSRSSATLVPRAGILKPH